DLPFILLADTDKEACEAYGVWQEKKNYGRTYMGVQRSTFLIDPDGKIARVWDKVKVKEHDDQVQEALQAAAGD
ncbi:MAG: redoxin domain-containing protein, partial [Phycisphaeraceae bacterium]|nr:redoxin domain-containing protein [Phycisphaeraceae bacterium]